MTRVLTGLPDSVRKRIRAEENRELQREIATSRDVDLAHARSHVHRCEYLAPGCRRFFVKHRRDKVLDVCGNARCLSRKRTLDNLVRDGRMDEAEHKTMLDAYAFEFEGDLSDDALLEFHYAHFTVCSIKAPGCWTVVLKWRKNQDMARPNCGNARCRRLGWARRHGVRKKRIRPSYTSEKPEEEQ